MAYFKAHSEKFTGISDATLGESPRLADLRNEDQIGELVNKELCVVL